jgi:hypothetical protein
VTVKIPVENGVSCAEGIIEKLEIIYGVYLFSSLTMIEGNQARTSILNIIEVNVVL